MKTKLIKHHLRNSSACLRTSMRSMAIGSPSSPAKGHPKNNSVELYFHKLVHVTILFQYTYQSAERRKYNSERIISFPPSGQRKGRQSGAPSARQHRRACYKSSGASQRKRQPHPSYVHSELLANGSKQIYFNDGPFFTSI